MYKLKARRLPFNDVCACRVPQQQQKKLVFKAAKPKRSRKEKSKQRKIVTVNDGERAKEDLEGND